MSEIISVILPTYNRVKTLDRSIESVLLQSYPHWRLYVVDDASSDESLQCIEKWQRQSDQVELISLAKNQGVSFARNRGIEQSKGPLISFIDSDDQWLPNKLQDQVNYLQKNPSCQIVHGEEIWIRNNVRVNPMKKHQKKGGWIFLDCLKLCCISPSTVMLKRELLEQVGLFREDFPACEDYDLWLRVCSQNPVGFIETPLIKKYGGHEDQLSRRYKAMDYWRIQAIQSILETPSLKGEWREIARENLNFKRNLLLKGCRKHENLDHYDKIFSIH